MPSPSFSLKTKALTIIPVALLSGAWTISLVNVSADATATGDQSHIRLPNGVDVPDRAIEAPASIPEPGRLAPGVPKGSVDAVVAGASTSGIPSVALAAYQRTAQIIDTADKNCNIPWELLAAIGRVESNHGRFDGSALNRKGVDTPAVFGPLLDGKHNTQTIMDTDGGRLDGNATYDRAVGPMQFLPSTWEVVKVDADDDSQRNPQDIDDASLAAAVYLCSGNENLSTRQGQQAAVYRYNHSHPYVNLVLRIMEAYSAGDYTAVPSGSYGGTLFSPSYTSTITARKHAAKVRRANGGPATAPARPRTASHTGGATSTSGSSSGGTGSTGGTGGLPSLPGTGGSGGGGPVGKALDDTVNKLASALPSPVQSAVKPVTDLLTQGEANTACGGALRSVLGGLARMVPGGVQSTVTSECTRQLTGEQQGAQSQAPNLVTDLLRPLLKPLHLAWILN